MTSKILGVKVDFLNLEQASKKAEVFLSNKKKAYIVTPNPEIIVAAQKDKEFKEVLNNADLSIPDSSRLGWAEEIFTDQNIVKRIFKWFAFLIPKIILGDKYPVVSGIDLMENLIQQANKKAFVIGFLGGRNGVAVKAAECLKLRNKNLKIAVADSSMEVNDQGDIISWKNETDISRRDIDILFVAFGHIKQEKWITKNLDKFSAKVMMAVGGSLDYLSGSVPRAPKALKELGFEWLFRLMVQPWRIKRFGSLVTFVYLVARVLVFGKI